MTYNIPSNPFPNMGTPQENIRIDPIGYENDIEDIKITIMSTTRDQPIIINVYGEYGQGKTTFLKYLEDRFHGDWVNYTVASIDFTDFDDLENQLVLLNKQKEKEGTEGVFLVLDEGKHVFTGDTLTEKQNEFLTSLRKFADGEIKPIKKVISSFVICLAMHPETKTFLKKYGHYDLEQRRGTLTVDLKDVDYYTCYMIVKNFVYEKSKQSNSNIKEDFTEYFDESFVNAFYALLSGINFQNHQLRRFNGRTYAQIFFELFKYYLKKGSKLDFDDLKNILVGKKLLKLRDAKLSFPNPKRFYDAYNLLNESEKVLWNEFVFNPRWHFDSELTNAEKYIVEKLVNREYLSKRECVILTPKDVTNFDDETVNNLNELENHRVYLNGEKILFFLDIADKKLLNRLKDYKINNVYRLDDFYLKILYDFEEVAGDVVTTKKFISYYKSNPSEKVDYFYDLVLKMPREIFDKSEIQFCKVGTRYKFLDILYKLEAEILHRVAIFYYSEGYASDEFEKYFIQITNELENSNYSLAIIFICPMYNDELPKEKVIIRNLENRLFIDQINRKEMARLLDGDLSYVDTIVRDSIKLYTQETVKKGYTLPLTGFKQKIKNKPTLFRDKFLIDIENAWKIELDKKSGEQRKVKPEIFKSGIDGEGKLVNLANQSFSEFVELDEYNFITGCKFSKYEKNFLNLFGTDEEPIDEIRKVQDKYFAYYSRFNIEEYVTRILNIKSILKEEDGKYILIKPSDYLNKIFDSLNSIDISILLRKEQDITLKSSIFDLKLYLEKIKDGIDIYDRGFYNSEMEKIYNKINKVKAGEPDLIDRIIKKFQEINEKLNLYFIDISIQEVNITRFLEKIEKDSILSDLNNKNTLKTININYDDLLSLIGNVLIAEQKDDIDKELLFALEDIINKTEKYNIHIEASTNLNDIKTKINNLKHEKFEKNNLEITLMLKNLIEKSNNNFSTTQLKIIYQILDQIDSFILNPIIDSFKKSSPHYEEIKDIKNSLTNYKNVFSELKTFYRKDKFLDNVQTIETDPEEIEVELNNLQNIAKYNLEILDNYSTFVSKNYKTTEIDKIIEMETEIKNSYNKDILEYLNYIKSLNSLEYITNYVKSEFNNEKLSEKDLLSIISEIKNSEEGIKNKDNIEIINNYLLPNGFFRRITQLVEYYKNEKPFEKKNVDYQIEGV